MSGQLAFRPYPQARFASRDGKAAVSVQHTPRQNHLLAALARNDYERLLPDLEPVPLPLVGPFTAPETGKTIYIFSPRASFRGSA